MATISKVLVVLASPEFANDQRGNYVIDICKQFVETLQTSGLNVDVIDLYKDYEAEEFDPITFESQKETKILEYQVRIRKAEVIIFFHPVWQGFLPAILKGFTEKVFTTGFAFSSQKNPIQAFLEGKRSLVFSFSEKSKLDQRIIHGNMVEKFWLRSIFRPSGIAGKCHFYGDLRSLSETQLNQQTDKILKIAQRFTSSTNILDLI
jgi:putative NADPH-quinone reductase